MKKIIILLIIILSCNLFGCDSTSNDEVKEKEIEKKEGQSVSVDKNENKVDLSQETVLERLSFVPTIIDVEIANVEDEKGITDTLDKCSVLIYFASELVNQEEFEDESTAEKGTACGGSVEIFANEEAAERDEYLNGSIISMMSPGTHAVDGKIVVRISKEMTEKQQDEFEKLIFTALTTTEVDELFELQNFIFSDYEGTVQSNNATENDTKKNEEIKNEEVGEGNIKMPESSWWYESDDYTEVLSALEELGFENIKTTVIYDLGTGMWDSLSYNEVESVSISGDTEFEEGQVFSKDVEVVVAYHAYEKDNPDINYIVYTAYDLLKDLDNNPVRAEKNHTGEYAEISGVITEIHNDFILLHDTKGAFLLDTICCKTITDEQEEHLLSLNTGDTVTIRGKIRGVNVVYPYYIDIYSFK